MFPQAERREKKELMGCRSTVGRLTLDQLIGVRIPAPQPYEKACRANLSTLFRRKRVLFFVHFCLHKSTDQAIFEKSTAEASNAFMKIAASFVSNGYEGKLKYTNGLFSFTSIGFS